MKKTSLIVLSVALFLIAACSTAEESETTNTVSGPEDATTTTMLDVKEGLEVGEMAPDVTLLALDGIEYRLSDFRGQVVFLNFWASWCGPCRAEMPSMQEMYEEYGKDGFIILAVDVGEDSETVQRFMNELALTFPAFLDENKEVYKEYNKSNGIPQSYIIDRQGIIREYIPGSKDWDTLQARSTVLRILGLEND